MRRSDKHPTVRVGAAIYVAYTLRTRYTQFCSAPPEGGRRRRARGRGRCVCVRCAVHALASAGCVAARAWCALRQPWAQPTAAT